LGLPRFFNDKCKMTNEQRTIRPVAPSPRRPRSPSLFASNFLLVDYSAWLTDTPAQY
jgi:hypothetical protein